MASPINIIQINPLSFSSDNYSPSDENLLISLVEENSFDTTTDYVELTVYNNNQVKIAPFGNDVSFTNYSILDNEIYINPETDLARLGIVTGNVNTVYNFLRKRLASSPQSTYYIKEISSDRTEIRLDSNIIPRDLIITSTLEFIDYRNQDQNFPDFYLNFGSNQLYIANNILLDTDNTVLIKLYDPLPTDIELKTSLWVVEKLSEGLAYRVEFNNQIVFTTNPNIQLKGPNLNLSQKDQLNNSTEATDLNSFTSPNSQSAYQIGSYFEDPSIAINVDYSDFSNFVHFSSAKSRLENFWYKIGLIQSASFQITSQSAATTTLATSASIASLNQIIDSTITNFDKYEYYLYFESSSTSYPKVSSTPPYENELTSNIAAQNWITSSLATAEDYDEFNPNWLYYSIPEYIREDSTNIQYITFTNMIGHFVDETVWIYLQDTTNKWDADNRINAGVSKDLVAQVLRDMGVKLYQNNYSSGDLYSSFLGFTDSGSLFPFPYMTGSLPTPSGYEYISNFISSSNEAIPLDDINKRIYKRIYHNLPYLLKSKGTVAGLRTLITAYGIPDTILRISEFGGKDRNNTNDWDLWKHQYNYQYLTNNNGFVESEWPLNSNWVSGDNVPATLEFRFKAPDLQSGIDFPDQVLWSSDTNTYVVLEYTGSGYTSGSYTGSIVDPYNQYATLKFVPDWQNYPNSSASVYLPFYDGNWWSVAVTREANNFNLFAGNKIYSGSDGSKIGFVGTSSISEDPNSWLNGTNSYFPSNNRNDVNGYSAFSGSYQEIRYLNTPISYSVFEDYVMNPQSTEGNGVNGSYSQLAFRATLGGELYTGSVSTHPRVSGSYVTQSFASDSDFVVNNGSFTTNREWVFYDSPPVGIKNRNTDKIKQQELILPSGDTLSNLGSIQQQSYTTQDYTNNLNLLEVAFSPQNQINDDIIGQIGYFNIGDYIGDPRLISSSANTYPSLVELSQQYFDKYSSNYDVYDYIRLIKFFDNSLFKMVKDFVPARTGIASGIVIKQHILERQKYPQPQASWTRPEYSGSIGSLPGMNNNLLREYTSSDAYTSYPIESITGSAAGATPTLTVDFANSFGYTTTDIVNVTQSYNEVITTPLGYVSETFASAKEFIDGEYSGSTLTVTTQSLDPYCFQVFLKGGDEAAYYTMSIFSENDDVDANDFLNFYNTPLAGQCYLYWDAGALADPVSPGGPVVTSPI